MLILYVTLIGAAVGVRDAGHIGMESLLVLVPDDIRRRLELVIHVLVGALRRADGLVRLRCSASRCQLQDPDPRHFRRLALRAAGGLRAR